MRSVMMTGPGGYGPGRWVKGGMWVRGLCASCNNFAGAHYDSAYADFARQVEGEFELELRSRLWAPRGQAVSFAPGRVSRSAMSGMFALSRPLRELHPVLADQMKDGGPVHLPGQLTLRVAGYMGRDGQLCGPMLSGTVDGTGRSINTLASISWRPLTWALATSDSDNLLAELGWVDATGWLRYGDERESHDLRWLAPKGLPLLRSILHAPSDDGFQMYSSEITPIMMGRLPL
jgi:hypothetical protein